jgi:Holliday junction resolvase RusA-like endonuclease
VTRFTLPGDVPDTRPRARVLRLGARTTARAYTAPRYREWMVAAHAEAAAVWGGRAPLGGPLEVRVLVVRQSADREALAAQPRRWREGKPDADNAAKAALDALVAVGVMGDDVQVVALHVEQVWGATAGAGGWTSDLRGPERQRARLAYARERRERSALHITVVPVAHQWGAAGGER